MKAAPRNPRWALSFADLSLVLLAFFVLLHARQGDGRALAQGMRAAFGNEAASASDFEQPARLLFEAGEAVLKPREREYYQSLGKQASTSRKTVHIASRGLDSATRRLDGWELAAARTAAVARAVQEGGVAPERITVAMPELTGADAGEGQRITVTLTH